MREMNERDAPQLVFPAQNTLTGPLRAASAKAGNPDYVSMWAGQAAPLARELSAAQLIATLEQETKPLKCSHRLTRRESLKKAILNTAFLCVVPAQANDGVS